MSRLFVPIGIPGSGKSTWAQDILCAPQMGAIIVSTDAIRDEVHPGMDHDRIADYLGNGRDVVADATNLSAPARNKLRSIGCGLAAPVHYVIFQNLAQAIRRNRTRDRVVPPDVMERMILKYEEALRDIKTEAVASVTYIGAFE